MELRNDFSVAAPVEETWQALLDLERVAGCLPGATIEAGGDDGTYRGTMKVKLGPMTMNYRGTVRLEDVDEDTRSASIVVQAREEKGSGAVSATIRNHIEPREAGTQVTSITELAVSGRQAQFGRAVMQDVADKLMGEFGSRLENELQSPTATGTQVEAADLADDGPGRSDSASSAEDEALDLGAAIAGNPLVRQGAIAGALLVVVIAIASLLGRRRRQLTLNINLPR